MVLKTQQSFFDSLPLVSSPFDALTVLSPFVGTLTMLDINMAVKKRMSHAFQVKISRFKAIPFKSLKLAKIEYIN